MDEQTTWKSHSFTLLVFAGIVVLCSIFFILGMLVGRGQGQRIAEAAAETAAAKAEAKPVPEQKPDLTFYESVEREKKPLLDAPKVKPEIAPAPSSAAPTTAPAPAKVINYQVAALRRSADADKLLEEVKKKGFRAFILAPASGEADPYYRVQVGPFPNVVEGDTAKRKLEAAGYKPILKK